MLWLLEEVTFHQVPSSVLSMLYGMILIANHLTNSVLSYLILTYWFEPFRTQMASYELTDHNLPHLK